ncbi:MAG TPA: hypothetical protein VH274_01535 [Mycobacteriales bacterium]|nr:hypothetical protein [Mycobacteriales bacterium]
MKISRPIIAATAAALAATTAAGVTFAGPGPTVGRSASGPDPANFTHPQQNSYFPLAPGTVTKYRGVDSGQVFHERTLVTHKTKRIQGINATVVLDVLRRSDGTRAEKTHDWYAADNDGNVWYLGEDTATYHRDGTVGSREGSWQSGVHGAVAGLIMPTDPKPTKAYRQEYWPGHAEDQGWVVSAHETKHVPTGTYRNVVRTYEWSRLEKNVVGLKFYAPGVGPIIDRELGGEDYVLVSVSHK